MVQFAVKRSISGDRMRLYLSVAIRIALGCRKYFCWSSEVARSRLIKWQVVFSPRTHAHPHELRIVHCVSIIIYDFPTST